MSGLVPKPYVGAVVQYIARGRIYAAIVTEVLGPQLGRAWRDPVHLSAFNPSGGLMPQRMVERSVGASDETAEATREVPCWRWPPELVGR